MIVAMIVTMGLMSSCSTNDDSSEGTSQNVVNAQIETVDPNGVPTRFIGTWATDCLPGEQNTRDSFIYDGENASFITQTFSDALCENALSANTRSGKITFGESIVESTFGLNAYEIAFASDETIEEDFRDIIYARDELLYFGDKETISNASQTPVALDSSRTFNYTGLPDFTSPDLNLVQITLEIADVFDDLIPVSNEQAISEDDLVLSATINGLNINLSREAGGWVGQTTVPPNTTVTLVVDWHDNYSGELLLLARASAEEFVDAPSIRFLVTPESYDTSYDADADGVSNLTERIQGTDPFDARS